MAATKGWSAGIILATVVVLRAVSFGNQIPAGQVYQANETVRLCKQLKNATNWEDRRRIFDALVALGMNHRQSHTAPRDGIRKLAGNDDPRAREALSESLIRAAAAENRAALNPKFSREEADLRVDLLWALSDLGDPRSTDVLLDAVNTGNMTVTTLAGFPNKSLPKVIERLNAKPDRETKLSLMLVILQMCEERNMLKLSDESKATVRETLLASLSDKDPLIRQTACKGLGLFADPTTVPQLERVAAKDPETSVKEKRVTYPIRDEARDAIEEIKERQPAKS